MAMHMSKTLIIGAGPVGTLLAQELAKKKHSVTMVEEHKLIGAPVQCTGILTDDVLKYTSKKDVKKVTKAIVTHTTIHSPNNKVSLPISPNYVVDNIMHCQMQAKMAKKLGVKILTRTRYMKNTESSVKLHDLDKKEEFTVKPKYLVGADGPTSMTAKNNGLYNKEKRKFLTGVQAVVKMKKGHYDEDIHFWPYIGEYAWYCPEGDGKARIGLAARHNAKGLFDAFMKKFKGNIEGMQGGPIPLYRPNPKVEKKYKSMRVQLIGDSVPLIKNTTGGGIIPGAKATLAYVKNPDKYASSLGSLKRELYVHYKMNKVFQKFSDKNWDTLVQQTKDEKVKHILESVNRDNAFEMAAKLTLAKPSFMRWGFKLF